MTSGAVDQLEEDNPLIEAAQIGFVWLQNTVVVRPKGEGSGKTYTPAGFPGMVFCKCAEHGRHFIVLFQIALLLEGCSGVDVLMEHVFRRVESEKAPAGFSGWRLFRLRGLLCRNQLKPVEINAAALGIEAERLGACGQ